MILARSAQDQRGWCRRFGLVAQSADGGLAMVAQQFDRLGEEMPFVVPPRPAILPPQLGEDFAFGLLAHKVVHVLGNTDFWRNDPFSPRHPPASGNKTFGADRRWTVIHNKPFVVFNVVNNLADAWRIRICSFTESLNCSILQVVRFSNYQEPTAVGAVSSAVAVHVASRRWLSFLR